MYALKTDNGFDKVSENKSPIGTDALETDSIKALDYSDCVNLIVEDHL
jgi:hypothetical protein